MFEIYHSAPYVCSKLLTHLADFYRNYHEIKAKPMDQKKNKIRKGKKERKKERKNERKKERTKERKKERKERKKERKKKVTFS